MKKLIILPMILFGLIAILASAKENPNGINVDRVEIFSVSTRIDQLNYAPEGSIVGGTLVYLVVKGHSTTPSQNKINIGPYNCIIPEKGINENVINCLTTQAFDPLRRWGLPVELHVNGKVQSKCSSSKGCYFNYSDNSTPFLKFITPSVATPDQYIQWNAMWRVNTSKDIYKLIVGTENCNRFDINTPGVNPLNLNDDDDISKNSFQYLPCQLSSEQVAGIYDVKAETVWGNPYKLSTTKLVTADGSKTYDVAITAEITSISSNEGGDQGNRLVIKGRGFGIQKNVAAVEVEGLACQIKSISNTEIECDLASGTTAAPAAGQFIGGQGVQLTRYRLGAFDAIAESGVYSAEQLKTKVQDNTLEAARKSESFVGNYEINLAEREGAHLRGYFKAPRTGNYKFWLSADDTAVVYLNTTPKTADLGSATEILKKCGYDNARDYFHPNSCGARQEVGQTLNAGEYYWVEAFAYNGGNSGMFTLSVETPAVQNGSTLSNYLNEMIEFSIKPEFQAQRWSVKMFGSADKLFKFSFLYVNPQTRKKEWDKATEEKKWSEWTDSSFVNSMNQAAGYYGAKLVESKDLDASGSECPSGGCTTVGGKEYIFEFTEYRPDPSRNLTPQCSQGSSYCVVKKLIEQSPPVGGTFEMKFGGENVQIYKDGKWTKEIPSDVHSETIKSGLVKMSESYLDIEVRTSGRSEDGKTHSFFFRTSDLSKKGALPSIEFDNSNLTGGKANTRPTIEKKTIIAAENRPFYEPVPFDMSFVKADAPSVQVKINNILSVCKGNCQYSAATNKTPVVTSFSATGNQVTMDLSSNNGVITFSTANTKIWYGGSACTSENYSNLSAVTCSVAAVEAGDNKPIVLVSGGFGFAKINGSAVAVLPSVTSVTPNTGSVQGGIQVTIAGGNFAISETSRVVVKFGTIVVSKIVSTSSTSIVVEVPKGAGEGAAQVTVEVNSKVSSNSQAFTYSTLGLPSVTSISLPTASPVIKQQMQIDGSNFGTDPSKLQVWLLKNEEKTYQLNILNTVSKPFSNTSFTVTLGGGHVGSYTLRVFHTEKGYSTETVDFKYIIEVHSISPSKGNLNGGSLIQINGKNFSGIVNDNTVFLLKGNQNSQCTIVSATSTSIVVRVPPLSNPAELGPYEILVQGRLQEDSTCTTGTCSFSYENLPTPTLNAPGKSDFRQGETLKLTGTNFEGSIVLVQVKQTSNGSLLEITNGVIKSLTELEFTFPSTISVGAYEVVIIIGANGYAGAFSANIIYALDSVSPTTSFSLQGTNLILKGTGFSSDCRVLVKDQNCLILSQTNEQIECVAPVMTAAGNYNVILQKPTYDDAVCNGCAKYSSSNQPKVTATGPGGSASNQFFDQINSDFVLTITGSENMQGKNIKVFFTSIADSKYKREGIMNGMQATFPQSTLTAGHFKLEVLVEGAGYAIIDNNPNVLQSVKWLPHLFTLLSGTTTTLAGGSPLIVKGAGFDLVRKEKNQVYICGHRCEVDLSSVTSTQLECKLPQINTAYVVDNAYGHLIGQRYTNAILFKQLGTSFEKRRIESITSSKSPTTNIFSNLGSQGNPYFDIADPNNPDECWIKLNAFEGTRIWIDAWQHRKYFKTNNNDSTYSKEDFYHSIFLEGSNDDVNWTLLEEFTPATLTSTDQIALAYLRPNYPVRYHSRAYKHWRVRESKLLNGRKPQCLVEAFIFGLIYKEEELKTDQDYSCRALVSINESFNGPNELVNYKGSTFTPHVKLITPRYSNQLGGETLKITGTDFGTVKESVTVKLDGIVCAVQSVTNVETTCITGSKGNQPTNSSLLAEIEVFIGGNKALVENTVIFYYGLKWSHDATWGGEAPPREGDSVFVPKNQVLIVDQSSPKYLKSVTVEGTLIFADNQDLTFDAEYIIVRGGHLQAGTSSVRYQNKLTITMHGNEWGRQLPEFGNKVLGCHGCWLELNGNKLEHTWTNLSQTADVGATTLKTLVATNWNVGDLLVIATTDYDGNHSEEVTITAITGTDITFAPALKYKHISATETYGAKQLVMQAEVGNLSRNIVFQGNPADSIESKYGAHLMVHGRQIDGTQAQITYVEFKHTGQPRIIGRYTVHFHQLGPASNSIVEGIAVHSAFARVVAIHSTNFLSVFKNVGSYVPGHNIFLEDGVETHNMIEGNLIVSPRSAFNMLQTDITVAGIWITNPTNIVKKNTVAGSQFYGLWYEIKERPETKTDMCPVGMPVLELADNVAHSNQRFGLRFFNLQPRKNACAPIRNNKLADPFSENPSIQYIYKKQVSYKNGESGILAEFMGNSIFEDCVLADNFRTGFQAHVTNFTAEPVIFRDSLVVGKSVANGEVVAYQTSAVLVPRTDGFEARNLLIHNFPQGTSIIESSSENQFIKLWTQGGYSSTVENLTIVNSDNALRVNWQGPLRNMIFDKGGSLTGSNVDTYITPYYPYFDPVTECTKKLAIPTPTTPATPARYNVDSVECANRVLRGIKFGNPEPLNMFVGQNMKIFNLKDTTKTFNLKGPDADFGVITNMKIKNPAQDLKNGWAAVIATGFTYNIHFNDGALDWSHLLLYPSYQAQNTDETIVLRFTYTEKRELFDIFQMVGGKLTKALVQQQDKTLFVDANNVPNSSASGCKFGDYYVDHEQKQFFLCLNTKGRDESTFTQVDMNAVYCRDTCPTEGFSCVKENIPRTFVVDSDPAKKAEQYLSTETAKPMRKSPGETEWQIGEPQDGDDVRIPCEWTMVLNKPELRVNYLQIDGTLRIDDSIPHTKIFARNIWVRGGKIVAGDSNPNKRFTQKLTITLSGDKNGEPIVIDDISRTGTKSLAVTGKLELYGVYPQNVKTRLAATATVGATQIQVTDDVADWQVGDEIVFTAAELTGKGFEKKKITAIDAPNKTITLDSALANWHYGNPNPTISSAENAETKISGSQFPQSGLDMRTTVGHITRNIKIVGEQGQDLGGHLQVYHYVKSDSKIGLDINARGVAVLEGVEMENMGQHDSENAGLHILYTNLQSSNDYDKMTILKGSSIHDCDGFCVNGNLAHNVEIDNSIIYNGEKFLIQALDAVQWKITNNLLIGARLRRAGGTSAQSHQWDPVALIHMYSEYSPKTHLHKVQGNIGSGSEGIGYAFPGTPCAEKAQNGFKDNEVGHSAYTGVIFNMKENKCYHVGHVAVFNSVDGVTLNTANSDDGYDASHMILAENTINIKLHTGSRATVHNNFLYNTFISALARPACTDCYQQAQLNKYNRCSSTNGIQLHITTQSGESFPWFKSPFQYDVICTAPQTFGSSFINDVELHNFRESYSAQDFPNASSCTGNRAFRNHRSAADATAGTYLNKVKCINCEKDGFIYLMEPREAWRGWFGGCGQFDCTGLENMLVQDLTGDFLGHKGTIISNNEQVADALPMRSICQFVPAWNAFDCQSTDIGILEWESTGDDKHKLSPVPVYVANDVFNNTVNMWREWEWQGPEPLNMRLNRFTSYVLNAKEHNITYSGTQSVELLHKLEHRTPAGEQDRYIIVKYHYFNSLSLEVTVNGKVVESFPFNKPANLESHKAVCGANNYFYDKQDIHFVITNVPTCQVKVSQLNTVQINLRIKMTVDEFYSDDARQTNFINRITAFLGIDFARVRIVGLVEGAYRRRGLQQQEGNTGTSQLQFIVTGGKPGLQTEGYQPGEVYNQLVALAKKVEEGANQDTLNLGYKVLGADYKVFVMKEVGAQENDPYFTENDIKGTGEGTTKEDDKNTKKQEKVEKDQMIAISIGIVLGVISAIFISMVVYHMWRKRQFKRVQNIPQEDMPDNYEKTPNIIKLEDQNSQNSQQESHREIESFNKN